MKNKILAAVVVSLFLISIVSAHMSDVYGMMSGVGGFGYGGMFFGWLIGLLVINI